MEIEGTSVLGNSGTQTFQKTKKIQKMTKNGEHYIVRLHNRCDLRFGESFRYFLNSIYWSSINFTHYHRISTKSGYIE